MLDWLFNLPWPTWDHLFQYCVVLVVFFGPKKILDWVLDKEWKWAQKLLVRFGVTAQRKLEITLHTREHGGPLKDCAECAALLELG